VPATESRLQWLPPHCAPLAAALLALACGCAPRAIEPRIVLERAAGEGRWRATYHLAAAAQELRFQRPTRAYREDVWQVVTPGWSLARRGEDELLIAAAGAASDRVVVEFPVYPGQLDKEYEAFVAFTDGSLALFTGHLYVTTEPPGVDGSMAEGSWLRRVELVPRDGEQLVVRGERLAGRTVWNDRDGDGTYVYFGGIEPLETAALIAVVDPGAPGWLVQRLDRLLPELFATYAERFGEPLPWKPVVLFNFEDREQSGLSSGGGTLTGLIQMTATGRGWHDETRDGIEHLLYLLSHEAVHLWNGQLHVPDEADAWMHEGSAEAFAELALLDSGTIDAARLAERRTDSLNQCAAGLAGGALAESTRLGRFRNYYACGNLIAVWSAAVLGDASDPARYFDLWRRVFAYADPEDASYDRESYCRALESLGGSPDAVARLHAFVDGTHDDPATAITSFLGSAGIEVVRLDRAAPPARQKQAVDLLRHLMAESCAGRIGFYAEWPHLRTEAIGGCEPFARELRIVAIEDHDVVTDGDRALRATIERCRAGKAVALGLVGGGAVVVPCPTPPVPAPAPLAFPEI
jgi:hypothetical protein